MQQTDTCKMQSMDHKKRTKKSKSLFGSQDLVIPLY
jgi:hypothetical protein